MLSDEENFIRISKNSDHQSFQVLFKKYYISLCAYALKIMEDPDEAEDVVSHVFLKLWSRRESIEINSSFKYYLFAITRNRCIDVLKKNKRSQGFQDTGQLQQIVDEHSDIEKKFQLLYQLNKIEGRLRNLPPKCQQIFRLSREQGLKYSEIAAKLKISVKTVETQMTKALKELRKVAAMY